MELEAYFKRCEKEGDKIEIETMRTPELMGYVLEQAKKDHDSKESKKASTPLFGNCERYLRPMARYNNHECIARP